MTPELPGDLHKSQGVPAPDAVGGQSPPPPTGVPGPPPTGDDDAWLTQTNRKGLRVRLPVGVLALVVVCLAGVWVGARLAHNSDTTTTTSPRGANLAAAAGNSGGAGQAGGPNGVAGPAGRGGFGGTAGTITAVDGNTITLSTNQGSTAKVQVGNDTTITKMDPATVGDLKTGTTIVVRGQTDSSGTTNADSVTIGSPGSGFGQGFGSGPGGGGNGNANGNANSNGARSSQRSGQATPSTTAAP